VTRAGLRHVEYLRDSAGQLPPAPRVSVELLAARGGQLVELGFPVVVRGTPTRLDQAAALEPVERWIERTLLHLQDVRGDLLDPLGYRPAVLGTEREGSQDQQVQRALWKLQSLVAHLLPFCFDRKDSTRLVEAQGK